jgi:LmbE family N-acetylglucosaminyl deacetylase
VTVAIEGAGTAESTWRRWLVECDWPPLDLTQASGRRVVVIAAHPDDEILGVAGIMMRLRDIGCPLVVVWATDGEASHPQSTVFTSGELAALRREESRRALAVLDIEPSASHHLGLPDGGLAAHAPALRSALGQVIAAGDVVLAPWEGDGHPDHEAAGAAALALAPDAWRYPIWMWHWAQPGDPGVPWPRVRAVATADPAAKSAAIAEFATQVRPIGPAPGDAAVLPPHILDRFARPSEWIIT